MQSFEEKVFIQDDIVPAAGADGAGKTAGCYDTPLLITCCFESICEAVQDPVDCSGGSEYDTCLHALHGICSNDLVGRHDLDLGKKGSSSGQGVHGEPDTGKDRSADVAPVAVHNGYGCRGTHVNDDAGQRIVFLGGDCGGDQVCRDRAGIIDHDRKTGLDSGADDKGIHASDDLDGFFEDDCQGRNNGGDHRTLDPVKIDTVQLQDKLHENTAYFVDKMKKAGFDIKPTQSAICAIMLYDAKLSQQMAARLLDEGIYVVGFYYPVVPKDLARIRVQVSAGHTKKQLDRAVAAFTKIGKELKVLK